MLEETDTSDLPLRKGLKRANLWTCTSALLRLSEVITPRTHRFQLSRSGLSPCPDIITVWLLSLVFGALVLLRTVVLCGARHSECVEPWSKTD